jgi:short-subunit dehydrogenase
MPPGADAIPDTVNVSRTHVSTPPFSEKYGPYALIAGGSDGLGAAFAEAIARRGVNLVLVARQADRLEVTAARLRKTYEVDVITIAANLADWDTAKQQIAGRAPDIGLLVYNAAYAPIGPFEDAPEEQLAQAAAVNVKAPLLLTKLLSAPMIERGRGGILLMSSLAGSQGSPNIATYAATKSFNTILAEGLWHELRPKGVDVLACVAGAILTPGYQQAETAKPAPGTLAPEVIAETALNALSNRNAPIVIPGTVNKLGRFVLARLLSRRAAIALMSKNTGGLS